MTTETKRKLKSFVISTLIGSSIGYNLGHIASYIIGEIVIAQEQEENTKLINELMQDTDVQVSADASTVINQISSINIDSMYMDALGIDKETLAMAYKKYNDESDSHQYQTLYDEKTDSIKWDEVSRKIYETSKEAEGKSNSSLERTESFSEDYGRCDRGGI